MSHCRRAWLVALLTASACRPPEPSRAQVVAAVGEDQFLADIAVRLIRENGPPARFDARPLRPDPDVVAPSTGALAANSARVAATRRRVLTRVSADSADALLAMRCPGWTLIALDSTLARPCPREQQRIYMIGTARPGPTAFPDGSSAWMRGASTAAPMRSVRVILLEIGPRGLAVTAYDHVYHLTEAGWRFLIEVPLFVME